MMTTMALSVRTSEGWSNPSEQSYLITLPFITAVIVMVIAIVIAIVLAKYYS